MTQTALRTADEQHRILGITHRKPSPDPLLLIRCRPARREATARTSIDELIWQAIADQPSQLYRGGA